MKDLFEAFDLSNSAVFDLSRIPQLLQYDAQNPMIFSSGIFFVLFFLFFSLYALLYRCNTARILYVVAFSLFFYYKSSGWFFLLLIGTATSDFLIGKAMAATPNKHRRLGWLLLSICINLGLLGYFKYFNFLGEMGASLLHSIGVWSGNSALEQTSWKAWDIFLPVGISFYTFQTMSYIIDLYRGQIKPLHHWIDYIFYVSFFPQLVAGPIVRAKEFIPQIRKRPIVTSEDLGRAVFLILCGLFKKVIISDYISLNFVDRIFDAPELYTGFENLLGLYGYALQIYCDFSGYSDMAIGLALLMGFSFPVNFLYPYQSATITEFWRRWHISLSSWLKDYLYISLGGNRKGKLRTYINLLLTMLIGGLWHGAAIRFILWGGIHGLALAIHKGIMHIFPKTKTDGNQMKPINRILGTLFTFHLVVFAWLFFRAPDMSTVYSVLNRIAYHFHPELIGQVISGYSLVFGLMFVGYVLHFLPQKVYDAIQGKIIRSPLILKAVYLVVMIYIVFQAKSADVQPFIYFQF